MAEVNLYEGNFIQNTANNHAVKFGFTLTTARPLMLLLRLRIQHYLILKKGVDICKESRGLVSFIRVFVAG